ncbi:dihydrofolate reductase family protein [Croceicoccus naphthovorans]|uniref:Uncharacterized protein n=1 Tax=Croceicoccus naphthovorans TaxID=1348774 RepID=A0A0G3XDH3_9SPHN|nr:dihydrofolate reductase family protein [Croceicoccus naphthovorans]AKM09237.1 hypothetical protein AB433_03430 [Croceicoccus naphthovorans]MBB3990375.1 dihydrofolate reductase [Croceicoccus naphthovorans]
MSREIIGGAFVSLDGVMQAPGAAEEDRSGGFAHGGWIAAVGDEGLGNQINALLNPPFDLLLGRRTYDIFAAYWPYMPESDSISARFAACRKYVMTHGDQPLDWVGSERVDSMDALRAIKQGDGPPLVIQGSTTLYPQLLAERLLDKLVLMMAPVVLGKGKRMFADGTPPLAMRQVEARVTSGGFVLATYVPDGPAQVGSFGPDNPSEAEKVRRRRVLEDTW